MKHWRVVRVGVLLAILLVSFMRSIQNETEVQRVCQGCFVRVLY